MPEKIGFDPRPTCLICKKPLEAADHFDCKKILCGSVFTDDEKLEFYDLQSCAKRGPDALTIAKRERLTGFGYQQLYRNRNCYEAMRVFKELQDFVGLRKVADWTMENQPETYDLPEVLLILEDYEGLRDLLNSRSEDKLDEGLNRFGRVFLTLEKPLDEHKNKYLENNGTPVATGVLNTAEDLAAIRNLASEYDIAVPIARGGLKQGAVADLWGMKTRIADIAAHKRKTPRGKWVSPVGKSEFTGKRVLLFDKDAVTGATIQKMMKMLARFKPRKVDVYFAHNIVPADSRYPGTFVGGLPSEVTAYCPANAPRHNTGDAFIEAHEKLGTQYGRRRLVERGFVEEFIPNLKKQHPGLVNTAVALLARHLQIYDSLNQYLQGVDKLREHILNNLKRIREDYDGYVKSKMFELMPTAEENLRKIMETTKPLPIDFETNLIDARYAPQMEEVAKKRGVENIHYPSQPLAAFHAARLAAGEGYDIALIVGPEGFAYEPYFLDLGIKTVAVNIPESREGEVRSIKLFDDLSILQGKKVLVVEDDVRTGATLQKILEALAPNNPSQLGLYLGQPKQFQITANIPEVFKRTYIAGTGIKEEVLAEEFKKYLESRGLRIFKNTEHK